jgi:hypothetical protein
MILTQSQKQMAEKIQPPAPQVFDYAEYASLDAETRSCIQYHTSEIRTLVRRSAQDIIKIGQHLISVKEQLEHGQFRNWLSAEFSWSVRTAARFMQVAKQFNCANLAQLDIAASALYLLAEPSTPVEALEEVLKLAKEGKNITYIRAKDIISKYKDAQELETSKPDTTIVPTGLPGEGVFTSSEVIQASQTTGGRSAAIVKPIDEQLPKQKAVSVELQVSKRDSNMLPIIDSDCHLSQDRARIEIKSLLEVGHQIYISDANPSNRKLLGEIAEVQKSTASGVEVVIKVLIPDSGVSLSNTSDRI